MADKQYFSLPEAARELGVSIDLLRRQYRKGFICAAVLTPGGQPRFSNECIEGIRRGGWPQQGQAEAEKNVETKRATDAQHLPACTRPKGEPSREADNLQVDEEILSADHLISEPAGRTHQDIPCWVLPDQYQLNRHEQLVQAQNSALNRVLCKIPLGATDLEKAGVHTLARTGIRELGDERDCETIFAAALESAGPALVAVELRQRKERHRALGLQMLPWRATDKDRREASRAIDKVLENINSTKSNIELRGKIEDAIEPIKTSIQEHADAECRLSRIKSLLPLAKLRIGTFLMELCDAEELDPDALTDWSWRQNVEAKVEAYLKEELEGRETAAEVQALVEEFLDKELEYTDDDE